MATTHPCLEVYVRCVDAMRANKLIRRESRQDKEFHFQNWIKACLVETGLHFEAGGRNTYPDFRLVASTDGFEVKGFGSYGDIMICDRKMYVAPTPFGLTTGTAHNQTLILPGDFRVDSRFRMVGNLMRQEAERLIVGYAFDLRMNELRPESVENPAAGKEHSFVAYRARDSADDSVAMREQREEDE